jgi:hypothetical protein
MGDRGGTVDKVGLEGLDRATAVPSARADAGRAGVRGTRVAVPVHGRAGACRHRARAVLQRHCEHSRLPCVTRLTQRIELHLIATGCAYRTSWAIGLRNKQFDQRPTGKATQSRAPKI